MSVLSKMGIRLRQDAGEEFKKSVEAARQVLANIGTPADDKNNGTTEPPKKSG